tara:strand:- start:7434 stop:7790 length:357 start_codon:yes stop_codon:yes gene_type:complete
MSRHEHEKIDFATPEPVQSLVFGFTEHGHDCEESDHKCYAKRVEKQKGADTSITYYLKFGRGRIFDPWGTFEGRERSANLEWKKVASTVFDQYLKYLSTRSQRHITQAERMIIDANQK